MTEAIKLVLIYGSTREGRFCDVVARWATAEIGRHVPSRRCPAERLAQRHHRMLSQRDLFVPPTGILGYRS